MESNVPRPPIESIDDLTSTDNKRPRANERANIRPLLTPRAIARGACGHSPSTTKYLAAWIATHGSPCLLSRSGDPWKGPSWGLGTKDTQKTQYIPLLVLW